MYTNRQLNNRKEGGCVEFLRQILVVFYILILAYVSYVDIRTKRIPNRALFFMLIIVIADCFLGNSIGIAGRLLGALIVSAPMFMLSFVKRGAFGGGDIKLMAVSGMYLGAAKNVVAFAIGIVVASVCAIICLILRRKTKGDFIAFGPFLSIGIVTAIMCGDMIIRWYQG